ncbi:MAG: hypothetical protein JWO13_2714 [Acidobacteriales bacterium]|nr:hypothetical protein [Terriglobales bacterium]
MTSEPLPVDVYEARAAQQRQKLHGAVGDLRDVLRHKLDVKANAREYMATASGVLAIIGLAIGYSLGGIFFAGRERRTYGGWYDLE